ncbi:interleukin-8-like [Polymixia lowei]
MFIITAVALLSFLTITEGMSLGDQGVNLRCRCISKEKKPMGRHVKKLEVIPANSHCEVMEIIATLRVTGFMVCLDPNVPWVKRVLKKKMSGKK